MPPPLSNNALAFKLATYASAISLLPLTHAHEHHNDRIPEGAAISPDPLDTILWVHIIVQIVTWGIIFPTGMVLGIVRSRWHVPTQILGTMLAVAGYFLGHKHKGRQFSHNIHASFAPALGWMLAGQVLLGIYLRLHLERGFFGRSRRVFVFAHGLLGKALPVAAWVQMLYGGITALGFCRADHLGQCLAHFIMGSAFIAYGILLTILLLVGQYWMRRTGRSQEFFDSIVIAAWGCVNTFTEHRWGNPWAHNDLQHTSMGIVWWCAGLVGIWLSRKRDGSPKRNLIPGIVILLTGFAMSAHPQNLPLSTKVHTAFGWTLMAAGATRIVEIAFVLRDKDTLSVDGSDPNSFQYLPPFLLYASGFLFMGATEEQMAILSAAEVTHVSYILILYSIAFLLFLFVNVLLHIYAVHANSKDEVAAHSSEEYGIGGDGIEGPSPAFRGANGATNKRLERDHRQAKHADEFELDALISDDEDEVKKTEERINRMHAGQEAARTREGMLRLR